MAWVNNATGDLVTGKAGRSGRKITNPTAAVRRDIMTLKKQGLLPFGKVAREVRERGAVYLKDLGEEDPSAMMASYVQGLCITDVLVKRVTRWLTDQPEDKAPDLAIINTLRTLIESRARQLAQVGLHRRTKDDVDLAAYLSAKRVTPEGES